MLTVYTAIIGPYDTLKEPEVVPDDVKFVCFTDQPFESDVWDIRPAREIRRAHLNDLSDTRLSRWYKIYSHLHFDGPTLWVDGSIQITDDCRVNDTVGFTLFRHPRRSNIYREATESTARVSNVDAASIANQSAAFAKLGMPESAPLYAGGVLYRCNNYQQRMFNEAWWRLYVRGSTRDQLSLNFLIWLLDYPVNEFSGPMTSLHRSPWHEWEVEHVSSEKGGDANEIG